MVSAHGTYSVVSIALACHYKPQSDVESARIPLKCVRMHIIRCFVSLCVGFHHRHYVVVCLRSVYCLCALRIHWISVVHLKLDDLSHEFGGVDCEIRRGSSPGMRSSSHAVHVDATTNTCPPSCECVSLAESAVGDELWMTKVQNAKPNTIKLIPAHRNKSNKLKSRKYTT